MMLSSLLHLPHGFNQLLHRGRDGQRYYQKADQNQQVAQNDAEQDGVVQALHLG